MELTKDEAIRLHREMWGWLAENPEKMKCDWPRWKENGGDIEYVCAYCFACELSPGCDNCILVWPCGYCANIKSSDGLYGRWYFADISEKARLAEQIRDLPVRED